MSRDAAIRKIAEGLYELADALFAEDAVAGATAPVPAAPANDPGGSRLEKWAVEEVPEFPPTEYEALPFTSEQTGSSALGRCPAHDRSWTVKAAGVSKAGKSYSAFFKCDGKDADGTYCNRKPVKAWADAHAGALR
jgi:hypothetical protein